MQDGVKLERKTKDELKQIAQGLGIEKISTLKKDEIIALIREKREQIANEEKQKVQPKKRERPADAVEVKGVLDVMTDGNLKGDRQNETERPHPPEKQNHGVCPRDGGHQQGDRQYSAG